MGSTTSRSNRFYSGSDDGNGESRTCFRSCWISRNAWSIHELWLSRIVSVSAALNCRCLIANFGVARQNLYAARMAWKRSVEFAMNSSRSSKPWSPASLNWWRKSDFAPLSTSLLPPIYLVTDRLLKFKSSISGNVHNGSTLSQSNAKRWSSSWHRPTFSRV